MNYIIMNEKKQVVSWGKTTSKLPYLHQNEMLSVLSDMEYLVYDACKGDLEQLEKALGRLKELTNHSKKHC